MDHSSQIGGLRRKACVNCTSAKAKCSPSSPGRCERCQRLSKECFYLENVGKKSVPRTSRVQKLEERLESMAALLASLTKPAYSASLDEDGLSVDFSTTPSIDRLSSPGSLSASNKAPPNTSTSSAISPNPHTTDEYEDQDIIDCNLLSLDMANNLLNVFRNDFVTHFPFVVIPAEITVETLRRESPFLFLTVMGVTMFRNSILQRHLGTEIQRRISARIVIGCEKNMDLLQGLLVHAVWYHYYFDPKRPQIFLMLQLCVTLIHDLGLDKNPSEKRAKLTNSGQFVEDNHFQRSAAEKRALLGAYFLSASFAMAFRKQSTMNWTKYMEQCCQSLAEAEDDPSDRWISPLVQLQVLSRRVSDGFSYDDVGNTDIRGEAAIRITTGAFCRDLERLRALVPLQVTNREPFLLDSLFLYLCIYEVALHDEFWVDISHFSATSFPTGREGSGFSMPRNEMLLQLFTFTQSYFEAFLSISTQRLFQLGFPSWSKLCYVLIVHIKLMFFNAESLHHQEQQIAGTQLSPYWNAAQMAEFPRIGALLIEKLAEVTSDDIGAEGKRDAFYHFGFLLKNMLVGYEKQINDGRTSNTNRASTSSGSAIIGLQDTASTMYIPSSAAQLNFDGNNTSGLEGGVDFGLPEGVSQELFQSMMWEAMLEDFTVMPLP